MKPTMNKVHARELSCPENTRLAKKPTPIKTAA